MKARMFPHKRKVHVLQYVIVLSVLTSMVALSGLLVVRYNPPFFIAPQEVRSRQHFIKETDHGYYQT